jgi:uncharacterized phiE125 gp8 family phage protein
MTLFRTVEPALEPVTLLEAKQELRIDHEADDVLIQSLIRAAREEFEASTGMALIDQHWRLALDRWPRGTVSLRRGPVREVTSVTVYGSDGEAMVLDPAVWQADIAGARLQLRERPGPGLTLNGIEIDFRAGFGEAGTDVPDLPKRAILKLAAHWYEFRASFGAGDQPVSFPSGYDRLIATCRRPRLA